MFTIPKVSAPLAKAIRTSEGILNLVVAAALAAVTTLDPSKLPPKEAGILLVVIAGLHGIQRTMLKINAVQYLAGIGPAPDAEGPGDPDALPAIPVAIAPVADTGDAGK